MPSQPARLTVHTRTRANEHEVIVVDKTAGPDKARPITCLISTPVLEHDEAQPQPTEHERRQIDELCTAFEPALLALGARFAGRMTSATKRDWLYHLAPGKETDAEKTVRQSIATHAPQRAVSIELFDDSSGKFFAEQFMPSAHFEPRELPRPVSVVRSVPPASTTIRLAPDLVIAPAASPPPLPAALTAKASPPSLLHAGTMRSKTDGLAVVSVLFSTVGFLCVLIGPLLGVILGLVSRGRIRRSSGQLKGDGIAKAGIVLGCLGIMLVVGIGAAVKSGKIPALDPVRIQQFIKDKQAELQAQQQVQHAK